MKTTLYGFIVAGIAGMAPAVAAADHPGSTVRFLEAAPIQPVNYLYFLKADDGAASAPAPRGDGNWLADPLRADPSSAPVATQEPTCAVASAPAGCCPVVCAAPDGCTHRGCQQACDNAPSLACAAHRLVGTILTSGGSLRANRYVERRPASCGGSCGNACCAGCVASDASTWSGDAPATPYDATPTPAIEPTPTEPPASAIVPRVRIELAADGWGDESDVYLNAPIPPAARR